MVRCNFGLETEGGDAPVGGPFLGATDFNAHGVADHLPEAGSQDAIPPLASTDPLNGVSGWYTSG